MYGYVGWTLLAAFLISLAIWIVRSASRRQIAGVWVYCLIGLSLWLVNPEARTAAAAAQAFARLAIWQLAVTAVDVFLLQRFAAPRFVPRTLLALGYVAVIIVFFGQIGISFASLLVVLAIALIGSLISLQDLAVSFLQRSTLETQHDIKVGDWIQTGQISGSVTAVTIRRTVIETVDNNTVLLPNSLLLEQPVTIVSRKHRRVIPFHVPYGASPTKALDAVGQAIVSSPINGVCTEPMPRCVLLDYHPSHVSMAVVAWLNDPAKEHFVVSAVLTRVHFALSRAGMQMTPISQPVTVTHADKSNADAFAMLTKQVETLQSIPIFQMVPVEAASRLAESLKHAAFGPGEFIVHQGEESGSMYIVTQGSVDVYVDSAGGMREYVATLEAGQFFGELTVFTGEKRTANVMAMTATECLVVDKASLMALFDLYPELAIDISEVITERQANLAITLERLDGEQKRIMTARHKTAMLHRIQRYLGVRSSKKAAEKSIEKAVEKVPEKAPDKPTARMFEKLPEKATDQAADRPTDKVPDSAPEIAIDMATETMIETPVEEEEPK
jgi:small-conductance mechanosensitive channel/CRP-like cAMP-binding protein